MIRYLALLFFLFPGIALAQTPTEYVRGNVDQVIAILADPQYADDTGKEIQLERIGTLVDAFFDAQELSKRALGQYWRIFTPLQREEFQTMFLKLIKTVYLKKSLTYNQEIVTYDQEILKSPTYAEVATTLTSASLSIPIVYSLVKKGDDWKVYDVTVENISLIKNYRSQFVSILTRTSPDQLISILRKKTDE